MKTTSNYKAFVLETNSTLKNEFATLSGAVKMLVNMEDLPKDVAQILRIKADKSPIQSAKGRHNIVANITAFAKGENDSILRKATKADREKGSGDYVPKTTFSPFWVLQQLYKMSK
jgi:hypothetical protein